MSSISARRAWAAVEMDLFSFERNSGVFMRGIRTRRRNLSGKSVERVVLNALLFNRVSPIPIVFGPADPPCPESLSGVRRSV